MFFSLFSTPPTRNAYFWDHFPSLPSFLTPSFPPSLPNRRSRYMFFRLFSTPPTQNTYFRTFFITFLFQTCPLLPRKSGIPSGPPSLPPLPPSPLPLLPALSLHVFLTFCDTSHTECLLFGPLSLPPLFSRSLPPSLPPQPAFSLRVFLTFFNPSHTECLLFGSYGDLSDLWRSMAGRARRAEPTWAGCGCGSLWLWLAVAVAGSPNIFEVFP